MFRTLLLHALTRVALLQLDVGLRCVRIVHTNRPENVSSSDSTGSIEKVTFMHENITGISLLKKIAGWFVVRNYDSIVSLLVSH